MLKSGNDKDFQFKPNFSLMPKASLHEEFQIWFGFLPYEHFKYILNIKNFCILMWLMGFSLLILCI